MFYKPLVPIVSHLPLMFFLLGYAFDNLQNLPTKMQGFENNL